MCTVVKVKQMIVITWIVAAIVMIPLALVRTVNTHNVETYKLQFCLEQWPSFLHRQLYDIFLFFIIYVIPGTLVIILYSSMGFKLWAGDRELKRNNSSMSNDSKLVLGRRRIAKMMIIISVLFAVSWLPYYILTICMDFGVGENDPGNVAYSFALLLGHSNSAQNPILYCFMHRGFQSFIKRLLHCKWQLRVDRQVCMIIFFVL